MKHLLLGVGRLCFLILVAFQITVIEGFCHFCHRIPTTTLLRRQQSIRLSSIQGSSPSSSSSSSSSSRRRLSSSLPVLKAQPRQPPTTTIYTQQQQQQQQDDDDDDNEIGTTTQEEETTTTIGSCVQVFDNVVSPLACQVMHCLAVEQSFQSDGETCIFQRYHPTTPLECCIDRILTSLDDNDNNETSTNGTSSTSQTIEYWSRDEYMNIDTHVDIDENHFLLNDSSSTSSSSEEEEDEEKKKKKTTNTSTTTVHCPLTSHVLYLDIQQDLKGPTCIFPTKQMGWDNTNGHQQEEGEMEEVDLVIVPAVNGRLLRFPGTFMHGVPFPPNRWMLSKEEEIQFRRQEEEEEEEECDEEDDDDDDDDDDDYVVERSVLLFNTWSNDGPTPKGAYRASSSAFSSSTTDSESEEGGNWEEDYGVYAEKIACNPRKVWYEQEIHQVPLTADGDAIKEEEEMNVDSTTTSRSILRVNLMGPQERRIHPEEVAELIVSENRTSSGHLENAFHETKNVTCFTLYEKQQ